MSKNNVPLDLLNENRCGVTVRVYKPSTRYFDEFLQLKCAPDLARLKLYPNGKEVTESFAIYHAIKKAVGHERFAESITLVDVGCGRQPRNAALFAHRTRWNCIAVDPLLEERWCDDDWYEEPHGIDRLVCYKKRVQQYRCQATGPVVVAMVHAHVDVPTVLRSFEGIEQLLIVSMPCCVPSRMTLAPNAAYYDHGCWSPQRHVNIWDLGFGSRVQGRS